MLIIEIASFGEQGLTLRRHPLPGTLTPQEIEAELDRAADAVSEPEERQDTVFSTRAWPVWRRVVGPQDGSGGDLTVVTVRRFGREDYLRDLQSRVESLTTFENATLPLSIWPGGQRALDELALRERLSLTAEAAHILSLVPLPVATRTVTASQAAALIRAQYETPSP